jgi:predicted nucleic acid-binding protein
MARRCAGWQKIKSWNLRLVDLRDGDSVFIDANIFIYHLGGRSAACKAFLERCARRELVGYTSTSILAEVLHRLMVAEAIQMGLVTSKTAVKQLKEDPDLVKRLSKYHDDVEKLTEINLVILGFTVEILMRSKEIRQREGLLTNDSLVVAFIFDQGLTKLATANGDFNRVAGLELHEPGDL